MYQDRAGLRLPDSANIFQQSGFAGAIRPDDAMNHAGRKTRRDAVKNLFVIY
jgi:hypothetical protein